MAAEDPVLTMMTAKERFRRLCGTVLALAVTCAAICLMRELVRTVVFRGGFVSVSTRADVEPPLVAAPRKWDLGDLIPPDLRQNVGGMRTLMKTRVESAPVDLSRARLDEEAKAKGWERIELPLSVIMRMPSLLAEDSFVTRDGEYRAYSFRPGREEGTSVISETVYPLSEIITPATGGPEALAEAAVRCGPSMRRQLPKVIADIVDGMPIQSQLVPRNGGNGYHLMYVCMRPAAAAARDFMERTARHGWKVSRGLGPAGGNQPAFRFERDNLSVFAMFVPLSDSRSVAICRFADDENLISTENTKGEQQ